MAYGGVGTHHHEEDGRLVRQQLALNVSPEQALSQRVEMLQRNGENRVAGFISLRRLA